MTTASGQELKILIIAGEASGDAHGAELIRALKAENRRAEIIGCGGPRMRSAGQDQLFDLTAHAVVGLAEVIRHYAKIRGLFYRVVRLALEEQPDAIIFIDYPGFNLRLAAKLRNNMPNTRFIGYISPQVWAWKAGRTRSMTQLLDLLLVIFPFEHGWFAKNAPRLNVEWVGHPMLDRVEANDGSGADPMRICLLPGSREGEVRKHLPILWEAARMLSMRRPGLSFVWLAPDEERLAQGQKILRELPAAGFKLEMYAGYSTTHLRRCGLAWVASGTASLECAIAGVPQVVFYHVNPLTYAAARYFVKIKYLSMVNVLADEAVVPELIQDKCKPENFVKWTSHMLDSPEEIAGTREKMARVVGSLGGPGASGRAAQAILKILK